VIGIVIVVIVHGNVVWALCVEHPGPNTNGGRFEWIILNPSDALHGQVFDPRESALGNFVENPELERRFLFAPNGT
jgi:hypothetical protein